MALSPETEAIYDRLTEKQKRFVDLWTGDPVETAKLAGYSDPLVGSKRCMKIAPICTCIKEKRAAELKPLIASRQDRQKFWTDTMMSAEGRMSDRLKASELLGKSEGDFLDRTELTGKDGAPLIPPITIEWAKK